MQKFRNSRIRRTSIILTLFLFSLLSQVQIVNADQLPPPMVIGNSLELCLNSRYSQHSLGKTAPNSQQLSNILWAAGKAPVTGSYRSIYAVTSTGTYLYDPIGHSLSWYSNEVVNANDGPLAIRYESELDFDAGVSFMPAILASVSLWKSTESPVASCPKGLGYTKARLFFGVQPVKGLTPTLVVHSSMPQGQPGWLPDPSTTGTDRLEDVLTNLKYTSNFAQTNLTLQQISQILWAGYGCTDHSPSSKAGLTVPSAYAKYYLTQSIYLVNENGVYCYHNRNPSTNLATRDHRIEQLGSTGGEVGQRSADVRGSLRDAVSGLPEAPCYVILCLDPSSYTGQDLHFAQLETGFVAGNMLVQATAIDLGCHFKTKLTSSELSSIRDVVNIPSSHIPQAIVSVGPVAAQVTVSVVLQGDGRPDEGWIVPLTVKFFTPGADVLNDTPTYEFNLTTTKSGNTAICEANGIAPGSYDITALSEHTLMNVRRNVVISAPEMSVDLGTLLEGNANQDNTINLYDFAVLSMSWLASKTNGGYDIRADFDRNGLINASDLWLLATNWPKNSPVEIVP